MPTEHQIDSNFNWESIPPYLVGGQEPRSNSTGQSIGFSETGGIASLGRAMSDAVERSAHTPHSLAVFLTRKVHDDLRAHKRSKHWWGRFYNRGSGDHAHYIKLSGIHLVQILDVVDQTPKDAHIPIDAKCAIRLDFAAEISQKLRTQIGGGNN
ncbi:MAG: hypothetical protein JJ858_08445 [Rhizobiaceae bacterium]|nr:hypothetical protein [Rhizobiaceae bacterium]